MLAKGFRFAGQIGTHGKVESASIRATAAAARNDEEMIVLGGVSFVIVIVFYLIFRGGELGKIATKANRHAIESLLSSHRSAGWQRDAERDGSWKICKLFFTVHCNKSMSRGNRLS